MICQRTRLWAAGERLVVDGAAPSPLRPQAFHKWPAFGKVQLSAFYRGTLFNSFHLPGIGYYIKLMRDVTGKSLEKELLLRFHCWWEVSCLAPFGGTLAALTVNLGWIE